jgi:hypothetical protein
MNNFQAKDPLGGKLFKKPEYVKPPASDKKKLQKDISYEKEEIEDIVDLERESLIKVIEKYKKRVRVINLTLIFRGTQGRIVIKSGLIAEISFDEYDDLDALIYLIQVTEEDLIRYLPLYKKKKLEEEKILEHLESMIKYRPEDLILDDNEDFSIDNSSYNSNIDNLDFSQEKEQEKKQNLQESNEENILLELDQEIEDILQSLDLQNKSTKNEELKNETNELKENFDKINTDEKVEIMINTEVNIIDTEVNTVEDINTIENTGINEDMGINNEDTGISTGINNEDFKEESLSEDYMQKNKTLIQEIDNEFLKNNKEGEQIIESKEIIENIIENIENKDELSISDLFKDVPEIKEEKKEETKEEIKEEIKEGKSERLEVNIDNYQIEDRRDYNSGFINNDIEEDISKINSHESIIKNEEDIIKSKEENLKSSESLENIENYEYSIKNNIDIEEINIEQKKSINESKMMEEINEVEDKITKYENKVINRRGKEMIDVANLVSKIKSSIPTVEEVWLINVETEEIEDSSNEVNEFIVSSLIAIYKDLQLFYTLINEEGNNIIIELSNSYLILQNLGSNLVLYSKVSKKANPSLIANMIYKILKK